MTPASRPLSDPPDDVIYSVGMLLTTILWDKYISSIFHDEDVGIVVILHNTCNQSFTYAVDEGQVSLHGFSVYLMRRNN